MPLAPVLAGGAEVVLGAEAPLPPVPAGLAAWTPAVEPEGQVCADARVAELAADVLKCLLGAAAG